MSKFNAEVMKSFGSALRTARVNAGFKHAKTFAETLNVPEHRYRAWERGEYTPNLMTLTRMCRALKVEPNVLLPLAVVGNSQSDRLSLSKSTAA